MTRRARTVALVVGLLGLQIVAVAAFLRIEAGRRTPAAFTSTSLPGSRAPALDAERPDGRAFDVASGPGAVRVVHFWATWCKPCVVELPTLLDESRRVPGIELVAVSVDSGWEEVRRFFPEGIPPEVVKARDRDAHLRYGSRTLPDSYIVSADGRLVERLTGARDWSTPAAQQYLRALGSRYR